MVGRVWCDSESPRPSPRLPRPAVTSENMGSFLAKSTTRVMAGVMIFVNSLNASRSTLSPSGMEAMGDWPMSSGCGGTWWWLGKCDGTVCPLGTAVVASGRAV